MYRLFMALSSLALLPAAPAIAQQPGLAFFSHDRGTGALLHSQAGLDQIESDQFALGQSLFNKPWVAAPASTTARDGLGPLFNANSCRACHRNNGGGDAIVKPGAVNQTMVFKLNADPVYGSQIATRAISAIPFEARVNTTTTPHSVSYADGTNVILQRPFFHLEQMNYGPLAQPGVINPRRAPALVGLGLIEQITDSAILEFEDIDDINRDGISGKANRVLSFQTGQPTLGRFGWKASSASVIEQSARAMIDDMGLTSPWFTDETCTPAQFACRKAYRSKDPDLPLSRLLALSSYLKHLKAPMPAQSNKPGQQLFEQVGCSTCHRHSYIIGNGLSVDPFSDFLLHDMGPELADQSRVHLASEAEWRTPPLWGIGLARVLNPKAGFLHDGRASTLEQAILWHGGEAEASKHKFMRLNQPHRQHLLDFLNSL